MVAVRCVSGCEDLSVTYHQSSDVFLIPLSTGVFYELKMVKSFFVKNAEQSELHSYPIERRLALFKFGHAWACVDSYGNIGRFIFPESVGWTIELSGRQTMVPVVVGPGLFKIMVYYHII